MSEKMYFCLLILCGLLCVDIPGVFSEYVEESSTLVRRKRVINLEQGGDEPVSREDAPFVVNIRELPGNFTVSVGAILSAHTVITASSIVVHVNVANIKLLIGSPYSYRGVTYDVKEKRVHPNRRPHSESIALLISESPFFFAQHTRPISLHQGPLLPGTLATVFGWGCNPKTPRGTNYRNRLRSITLPIMRHQECVYAYRNRMVITDKEICTYDANKYCGHTDAGAPLVVDNHLAGIYLRREYTLGHINPDVFIVVQHLEYSQWIRNNTVYRI